MVKFYKRSRKTTKVAKANYRRRVGSKPTRRLSSVKALVRREIARNVENKTVQSYNLGMSVRSVIHGSFASQVFQVSPNSSLLTINQGTGQGARVGNNITIKKLIFKGTIVPQQYSVSVNPLPQPVQIKMFFFYNKLEAPNALLNPSASNDFFQQGSSSVGFQNDLVDMWLPVNTDKYRVLATRTFKVGVANSNGTGPTPDFQYFSNNDFKLNCNFSFDLTKHVIKHVKYNDNTSDPSTRGLYCMIVPAYAGGGAISSSTTVAGIQWMLSMDYEDA